MKRHSFFLFAFRFVCKVGVCSLLPSPIRSTGSIMVCVEEIPFSNARLNLRSGTYRKKCPVGFRKLKEIDKGYKVAYLSLNDSTLMEREQQTNYFYTDGRDTLYSYGIR